MYTYIYALTKADEFNINLIFLLHSRQDVNPTLNIVQVGSR